MAEPRLKHTFAAIDKSPNFWSADNTKPLSANRLQRSTRCRGNVDHERQGRVLKSLESDGSLFRSKRWDAGHIVSMIGRRRVSRSMRAKRRYDEKKFGCAHDLRLAFGFRWAMQAMPAVLKDLTHHEDIGTT